MSLELIIAGVLMTTLTGYVLTGVADFGAVSYTHLTLPTSDLV